LGKKLKKFFPKILIFFQKTLDKAFQMWYNTLVVKGEHPNRYEKKIKKNFKKLMKIA
jgi:hypothetical protein